MQPPRSPPIRRSICGQQVITAAAGDAAAMNIVVGEGTDLAGSFCARLLTGTLPPIINDARRPPITLEPYAETSMSASRMTVARCVLGTGFDQR